MNQELALGVRDEITQKHEEEINLQLTEKFVDQWRRDNDRLVEPPGLTPQV